MKYNWIALFLFLTITLILGQASVPEGSAAEDESVIWTQWDSGHYALVDDGENIWIGTGSGLVKWNKGSETYTRISTAEGLPHRLVLSGAVGAGGNRWFGGDAGLSRLDSDGEWTHYNEANSGIFNNNVASIAASADGSVWLSHTDLSSVSRLHADGSWEVYANRRSAVSLAFESILQTLNQNDLWAVSDKEVWVGFDAFDGMKWEKRLPDYACDCPIAAAGGSGSKVWIMEWDIVFAWDGQQWWDYPFWYDVGGELFTLAVGEDDRVWVGGLNYPDPYGGFIVGIKQLPVKPGGFTMYEGILDAPPVVSMKATEEGVWAIGPNWLHKPDGEMIHFDDAPYYDYVVQVIADQQGNTWVHSDDFYYGGALQLVDDHGTTTMIDDQWSLIDTPGDVTALEPTPDGDLWVGWQVYFKYVFPGTPLRYHNKKVIEYYPPFEDAFIVDIFAEDARQTWFAYAIKDLWGEVVSKGVWSLDDGGTPADFTDDDWQRFPLESYGYWGDVAVVDDRLWYGDSSGLYLYQDAGWELVNDSPVRRLVPGASGQLYVDDADDDQVLIVEADGRQYTSTVEDLITHDLARIRGTTRRNEMWTVAPDGAVWYWHPTYDRQLIRQSGKGTKVFDTPDVYELVAVDENNQVWLANPALWRMSPQPDFEIEIGPSTWFMTANDSRAHEVQVLEDIGGYEGQIELSISELPAGVTAELKPQLVYAGEQATLRLKTSNAEIQETTITITAAGEQIEHQAAFTLAIVDQVSEMLLPVLAGK